MVFGEITYCHLCTIAPGYDRSERRKRFAVTGPHSQALPTHDAGISYWIRFFCANICTELISTVLIIFFPELVLIVLRISCWTRSYCPAYFFLNSFLLCKYFSLQSFLPYCVFLAGLVLTALVFLAAVERASFWTRGNDGGSAGRRFWPPAACRLL